MGKQKATEKQKTMGIGLREWYMATFPEDGLGAEMDARATFGDMQEALDEGRDVYDVLGVGDSIVRERIFTRLAEALGTDYDEVYELWLHGGRRRRKARVAASLA